MENIIDENKPLLIINRKKGFMIILYDIFYLLWMIATAFVCYIFTQLDGAIPNINGYIFVIFTPYAYFCVYNLRQIDCYEDYLVIKRSLYSETIYYNKLKDYKIEHSSTRNIIAFRYSKKFIFSTIINIYLITKNDFTKFI